MKQSDKPKVYCFGCEYCSSGYDGKTYRCMHPSVITGKSTFLHLKIIGKKCSELNRDNKCFRHKSVFGDDEGIVSKLKKIIGDR